MKNSGTAKRIIISIFLLIVAVSFYCILFLLIKDSGQKVSEMKTKIDEINGIESTINILRNDADETKDNREYLNKIFLQKDGLVGFLEYLENLGQSSGANLSISNVNSDVMTNATSTVENIFIQINIEGSFKSVLKTISLIENMPYNIEVLRASLSHIQSSSKNNKTSIDWKLDTEIKILKAK